MPCLLSVVTQLEKIALDEVGYKAELARELSPFACPADARSPASLQHQLAARGTAWFLSCWKKIPLSLPCFFQDVLRVSILRLPAPRLPLPALSKTTVMKQSGPFSNQRFGIILPLWQSVGNKSLAGACYKYTTEACITSLKKNDMKDRLIRDSTDIRGRYFLQQRKYLIFLSISHAILL